MVWRVAAVFPSRGVKALGVVQCDLFKLPVVDHPEPEAVVLFIVNELVQAGPAGWLSTQTSCGRG